MTYKREGGRAVNLNHTTLWAYGGWNGTLNLNTSEFITYEKSETGPELPFALAHHCMIKLNNGSIFIIAGGFTNGSISNQVWIVDPLNDFKIVPGHSMKHNRKHFACAEAIDKNGTVFIIVAGGEGIDEEGSTYRRSVEILNLSSSHGWMLGKLIKYDCISIN